MANIDGAPCVRTCLTVVHCVTSLLFSFGGGTYSLCILHCAFAAAATVVAAAAFTHFPQQNSKAHEWHLHLNTITFSMA